MEQSLRDADRRKDEFLAMLGHELRNPLAAVVSALEVFARLLPADDSRLRQVHGMAERQALILKRLVDDLLDSARIATGKIELRCSRVSMHEVLSAALESARPQIMGRSHHVSIEEAGEDLVVHGDAVRLVQVLSNLLNNAARYTPRGGRIRVALERSEDEAVVRVSDNGVGLDPDMQEEVFGLFVQARSPAAADPGLGLGLALVRRLVELHGGSASAHSAGVGRGSEFTVRLPLAPRTAPHDPEASTTASDKSHPARRILIVEDNSDAASALGHLLGLLGHAVEEVHDGRSALQVVQTFRPEVVLLDLSLPDMSGYDVARALRQTEAAQDAMIVAVTGFSSPKERSAEDGIDRFLTKPVDLSHLESLLETI
jgi:CheY-like chemotaxis protein